MRLLLFQMNPKFLVFFKVDFLILKYINQNVGKGRMLKTLALKSLGLYISVFQDSPIEGRLTCSKNMFEKIIITHAYDLYSGSIMMSYVNNNGHGTI